MRGRWRIGDQLTRRGGQPPPVKISFDDYVEDIAENRLVLIATTRCDYRQCRRTSSGDCDEW
ncbi:hypothetical protein Cus16_0787 [Curtobacterium sp. ER1/6]|nr:hypothetical protein Cus16_0787 [Curtobacterium sp. ER1/6]